MSLFCMGGLICCNHANGAGVCTRSASHAQRSRRNAVRIPRRNDSATRIGGGRPENMSTKETDTCAASAFLRVRSLWMDCPHTTSYRWRKPWNMQRMLTGASRSAMHTTRKLSAETMTGRCFTAWRWHRFPLDGTLQRGSEGGQGYPPRAAREGVGPPFRHLPCPSEKDKCQK